MIIYFWVMGQKSGRDFVNLEDLRNLKSKSTDLTHYLFLNIYQIVESGKR